MSKIIFRVAGLLGAAMVVVTMLFAGTAQAAGTANESTQGSARVQPTDETRAIVVGTISFVLFVGVAGGVLWHTARGRHSSE
ncbi:MAG TPA: hypothetical protein VJT49_06235 [Amycolatopsis sp.]|uniref:hypothetical protein n=1 Tax=Amycolatopsis sp. TaxID=37632 RepID=UPI002B478A86|nr:hypothetical protein [Amycolatopsis sp.]HKS44705.1 hypothetical protein [Amycolatopsis sp.]